MKLSIFLTFVLVYVFCVSAVSGTTAVLSRSKGQTLPSLHPLQLRDVTVNLEPPFTSLDVTPGSIEHNSFQATWNLPSDPTFDVLKVQVQKKVGESWVIVHPEQLSISTTSFDATSLEPEQTYKFRIRVKYNDNSRSDWSTIKDIVTTSCEVSCDDGTCCSAGYECGGQASSPPFCAAGECCACPGEYSYFCLNPLDPLSWNCCECPIGYEYCEDACGCCPKTSECGGSGCETGLYCHLEWDNTLLSCNCTWVTNKQNLLPFTELINTHTKKISLYNEKEVQVQVQLHLNYSPLHSQALHLQYQGIQILEYRCSVNHSAPFSPFNFITLTNFWSHTTISYRYITHIAYIAYIAHTSHITHTAHKAHKAHTHSTHTTYSSHSTHT